MRRIELRTPFLSFLALVAILRALLAQEPPSRLWVQLERARQEYEYWASEWERAQELYRQGLISEGDLRRTERDYRNAVLAYQEARLLAQGALFRIRIERAIKSREPDGSIQVRLRLRRDSAGPDPAVSGWDLPQGPIYISLMNPDGTVVAFPYEHRLPSLAPGQSAELTFALLEDHDVIRVRLTEGGQTYELPILLERRDAQNRLALTAEPFSQAADFGSRATYRLKLEYFGSTAETYQLRVSGLPPTVAYDFQETATQARMTHIQVDPMTRVRTLLLVVYLPERPVDPVQADRPLTFRVEVTPTGGTAPGSSATVSLELIPRGVGRLRLSVANLYEEIQPGQAVTRPWTVINVGERPLERVALQVEPPWQWQVFRSPETVDRLKPGEKATIQVTLRPPPDVTVGDYEATVQAVAWTGTQPIRSDPFRFRVHVATRGTVAGPALLLGALLLLLVGLVAAGIHIMKK